MTGTFEDDFEDGDADGWDLGEQGEVVTFSTEGSYSLKNETATAGTGTDLQDVRWEDGPGLLTSEDYRIRCTMYHSQDNTSNTNHVRFGIRFPGSSDGVMINFNEPNDVTFLANNTTESTPSGSADNAIGESFVDEWIRFEMFSEAESNVFRAKVWRASDKEPDEFQMKREFSSDSGVFHINCGNDRTDNFREAWLDSILIEGTASFSQFVFDSGRPVGLRDDDDAFVFADESTAVATEGNSDLTFVEGSPVQTE